MGRDHLVDGVRAIANGQRAGRAGVSAVGRQTLAVVLAIALTVALLGFAPDRARGAAVAAAAGCASTADMETPVLSAATSDVERIAGADRYATAVALSQEAFPATSTAVVITTGRAWPDALAASGLAGAAGGPVLLVDPDWAPTSTLDEIARLAPSVAYVIGGERAVSEELLSRIARRLPPGATITRLSGADRYETAARVASETAGVSGGAWDGTVFVATGRSFADGLSVAPVAAALGRPLFLIDDLRADRVFARIASVEASRAVLLGGTAAISPDLATRIAGVVGGPGNVERLAGSDRYRTALAVAAYAVREAGFSWARPALATSADFADGIASGPFLASRLQPLIVTSPDGLADPVAADFFRRRATVAGFTVIGGTRAVPTHIGEEALFALVARHFDTSRAMAHVEYIAGLGPRGAGGSAERTAQDYVANQLRSWGYATWSQSVSLPGGGTSLNVLAEKAGDTDDVILLGAHIDSKPPSPGGNDNASGVAVTLELARVLADAPTRPTIRFISFGAEEIGGATPDDHHFGSRQYVDRLSSTARARIHAMVSIDMVGYGDTFNIRSLGTGPQSAVRSLEDWGEHVDEPLEYLRDFGRYGWSDHEGFERAGIPAAWLEWRDDPHYHTTRDTASHVQSRCVRATGRLLRGWVLGMDDAELERLR